MKLKYINRCSNKLLKFKLIKTKIFIKKHVYANIKLETLEHRIKKGFQIIYKYHVQNKKILFVFPYITCQIKNLKQFFSKT